MKLPSRKKVKTSITPVLPTEVSTMHESLEEDPTEYYTGVNPTYMLSYDGKTVSISRKEYGIPLSILEFSLEPLAWDILKLSLSRVSES